jgi:hypothetical protein
MIISNCGMTILVCLWLNHVAWMLVRSCLWDELHWHVVYGYDTSLESFYLFSSTSTPNKCFLDKPPWRQQHWQLHIRCSVSRIRSIEQEMENRRIYKLRDFAIWEFTQTIAQDSIEFSIKKIVSLMGLNNNGSISMKVVFIKLVRLTKSYCADVPNWNTR